MKDGRVNFKLTKRKEVNVYLYKGLNRDDSTTGLVSGNQMPSVGSTYSVALNEGIMVVAYPNEIVETDFEFEYWVTEGNSGAQSPQDLKGDIGNPTGPVNVVGTDTKTGDSGKATTEPETDDGMGLVIGIAVGGFALLIASAMICVYCMKSRENNKIMQEMQTLNNATTIGSSRGNYQQAGNTTMMTSHGNDVNSSKIQETEVEKGPNIHEGDESNNQSD